MNARHLFPTIAAQVFLALRLEATDVFSFNNLNLSIPDGQPAGVSDVETISSSITQIGSMQVNLNIVGNFNGDLYCHLQYNTGLSVLLNRPGRSATNSFGYDDSGFNINLSDTAVNGNIHSYRGVTTPAFGSPLTGLWRPDGRTNSPAGVLDTDPSVAGLSVFNGMDPSGTWTLFIADLSSGGTSELESWGMVISEVPEPSVLAFTALALGVTLVIRRPFTNWRSYISSKTLSNPIRR